MENLTGVITINKTDLTTYSSDELEKSIVLSIYDKIINNTNFSNVVFEFDKNNIYVKKSLNTNIDNLTVLSFNIVKNIYIRDITEETFNIIFNVYYKKKDIIVSFNDEQYILKILNN